MHNQVDGLRNELYDKKINCPLAVDLTRGHKYIALAAGNDQLQQLSMTSQGKKIETVHRSRRCRNCATVHQPHYCPVFTDYCKAWAKCCRKPQQEKNRQHSGHRRSSSLHTYNRCQEQHRQRPHHRGSTQKNMPTHTKVTMRQMVKQHSITISSKNQEKKHSQRSTFSHQVYKEKATH